MPYAPQLYLSGLDDLPPPSWNLDIDVERGEVFTRRWMVDFVLDLAGYRTEEDLGALTVVEPACGHGAFLLPIVERLIESCRLHDRSLAALGGAIWALDLVPDNAERARRAVSEKLVASGERDSTARRLARKWVQHGDFLLARQEARDVDVVVGNPPYVRLENIPSEVNDAYRALYPTMRGRADLFVGFFEKGLSVLKPEGKLAFICADRWMKNQYGARLRAHVTERYAVDAVVTAHDVDAFENAVSAYPAVTVLRNGIQGRVKVVATNGRFDRKSSARLARWFIDDGGSGRVCAHGTYETAELPDWFSGDGHWPAGSPHALELLADLESRFELLEDDRTGTRVGIGVASGCDDVFVTSETDGVEESRLLPLLTARTIVEGRIHWDGRFLVNPWEDGQLVDLNDFPGLGAYLHKHDDRVRARHVAKKRPQVWYRTIDRVDPNLQATPKLLLPDIKSRSHPVLDDGRFYPHHNLYHIVSRDWDLEVLGGLLLSDVTNLFIDAYCVKMRGGVYRFQAQYLRKIRVPNVESVLPELAVELRDAFRQRDRDKANSAAIKAYSITGLPRLGDRAQVARTRTTADAGA